MSAGLLLWTLLWSYLRCGSAEGDPLPVALVELVRSNPVSSIEDLRLLLFTDSVEEEADRGLYSNDTTSRLPRSLGAQPAQQALCKVRTEVLEVTRTMLDRRNANFLLWPPCVEVQRCSGCCNARSLQCVPTLTHTRYLQVMKIQYVNRHPYYEKAVIPVLDHVECRCKSAAPAVAPRTSLSKPHPNRQLSREAKAKARSKEELHRQDELKHNQHVQLEDTVIEEQPWDLLGHMHTLATHVESGVQHKPVMPSHHYTNSWKSQTSESPQLAIPTYNNTTQPEGGREESRNQPDVSLPGGRGDSATMTHSVTEPEGSLTQHHMQQGPQPPQSHLSHVPQYDLFRDGTEGRGLSSTEGDLEHSRQGDLGASDPHEIVQLHSHTGKPGNKLSAVGQQQGVLAAKDRPGQLSEEQQYVEQERHEPSQSISAEEKLWLRRKEKHHRSHHYQHQADTQSATQRTVTLPPTSTRHPLVARLIRPPPRQNPPKKKKRKMRNRISKASVRAMLM